MSGLAQSRVPSPAQASPSRPAPDIDGRNKQSRYGNSFLAAQLPAREGEHEHDEVRPPPDGAHDHAGHDHAGHDHGQVLRGIASTIEKLKSPLPAVEGEQRREVLGVIILGRGVSPTALDACEKIVTATLANRKDVQASMKKAKAALVIVPSKKKMTEVDEFTSLKGTKTFDGRNWDDVRGAGGMRVPSGLFAIAVPEENLVDLGAGTDGYSDGYSVGLHELAHAIHDKGLPSSEQDTILELYNERKKAGGPWTEDYGASNEWEYFAQATNCFFAANDGIGNNGPGWLKSNDPKMYALLERIYGPPPVTRDAPTP
ncbi:MAG: hypothetical protein FJ102_24030 [Deltaproteobacteria bacterium]|nr:hypothetical protein [Deltaproteobacteria bacterium]